MAGELDYYNANSMDNARLRFRLAAVLAGGFAASSVAFAAASLHFNGNGAGGADRVQVPVDDPAAAGTGLAVNVGATDFTIEFWMRARADENTAAPVACGSNSSWREGHVLIDRNRQGAGRSFGVAIAGGSVVFGVRGDGTGDRTICGSRRVLDDLWHHVAVERRRSDGRMWVWVDGIRDGESDGPDGDVSYPKGAASSDPSDPYLVFGAEKSGAGLAYRGYLDEVRISTVLRYRSSFTRPRSPFAPDAATAALYRFDEGAGDVVGDASRSPAPSRGARAAGRSPSGPEWSLGEFAPLGGPPSIVYTLVTNAVSGPVHVTQAPGDPSRLFIVEQGGRIRVVENGTLLTTPFLDISDLTSDGPEQGLFSLAFDPDYATSGLFYVYYTDDLGIPGDITIARYAVTANPNLADPDSAEILLVVPHPVNGNHNGGQLMFSPQDGYLYAGTGDGGSGGDPPNNAQNKGVLLGKILRLDVNATGTVPCGQASPRPYGIPATNPFVGVSGCDEIWSYGFRNPWRFSFDRVTGDMLMGDVGQGLWEEIDFQPAGSTGGENYGWRRMEGFHCYDPAFNCDDGTLVHPILEYDHGQGCSVTGGFRYRGGLIPTLYGVYLYGDFCTGKVWWAEQSGNGAWTSAPLPDSGFNISSWGEDLAGELYVANIAGAVYKVTRGPNPVPAAASLSPAAAIAGDPGFTLTIKGTGFVYESVVRWNGSDRPTTFVSTNEITADISAADLASTGTAQVTVFSPGPGGGTSSSHTVPINRTFLDVPVTHFADMYITAVFDAGVTAGCGPRIYCPNTPTTRAQMAAFLLKASEGSGYTPPACTGQVFSNVSCGGLFAAWIEELAARGITGGCGGGRYCPNSPVTRAQMSAFLLKTDQGSSYTPPACTGTVFFDVKCTGLFDAWIEDLEDRNITGGCGGGMYCPNNFVTRAQMAVFLVRTFGIPLP